MIDSLSEDSVKAILHQLLEEERVTEQDLLTYLQLNPTNEMKRITDFVHLMFCVQNHEHQCMYDVEGSEPACWSMQTHQLWLRIATTLLRELGIMSEKDFRIIHGHAHKLVMLYHDMEIEKPAALALALKLLGLVKVSSQIELTSDREE
jgi:hypothetical protein